MSWATKNPPLERSQADLDAQGLQKKKGENDHW